MTKKNTAKTDSTEPKPPAISVDSIVNPPMGYTPFHTPDGTAYALCSDPDDKGQTVLRIDSQAFLDYLSYRTYTDRGQVPKAQVLSDARALLRAMAVHQYKEREVNRRTAQHGGKYWLDFGDKAGRMIAMDADGWEIVDGHSGYGIFDNKPLFVRPSDIAPFPDPVAPGEGDVSKIWELVNIPEERRDQVLAWMLECFRPETPYPVFLLCGGQGSAKSETQTTIRQLVDPSLNPLKKPANEDGLRAMAASEHVIMFENTSSLTGDIQDMLCSIATGGGGSVKRAHHENTASSIVAAKCPVMINAVPNPITRGDLLSRTTVVYSESIAAENRLSVVELKEKRRRLMPVIFGGLLDLFVATLKKMETLPAPVVDTRLVDHMHLGEAMSQALGRPAGQFLGAIETAVIEVAIQNVEENALGLAISNHVNRCGSLSGKASEMLGVLRKQFIQSGGDVERDKGFPANARQFSNELMRIRPDLERAGYVFNRRTLDGTQRWTVWHKNAPPKNADVLDMPLKPGPVVVNIDTAKYRASLH